MQRLGRTIAAAALAVGVFASPATASSPVHGRTPATGDVVTARLSLAVEVHQADVNEVTLRLSQDGVSIASGTASIPVPCYENCEGDRSMWGNRTFDPTMGAPFSSTGVCNGQWTLQARLDQSQWYSAAQVLISAAPAPATGVRAVAEEGFARVTWTKSKTPDVSGYRIERSSGSDTWITLGEVAKDATAFTDDTVSSGEWTYRVYAQRPDGKVNGKPAPPCSDKARDLEASPAEAVLRYQTTAGSSTPPGSGSSDDGQDDGSAGTGDSGSTGGSSTPGGSGTAGSGDPASQDPASQDPDQGTPSQQPSSQDDASRDDGGQASQGSTSSGRPRAIAPPPPARRQTQPEATAPPLEGAREYYYGEGEEFSEEIDYGDSDVIAGEQVIVGYDEAGEPIYEFRPGGTETTYFQILDASKIRVLAAGLLLVALALHGRRWLNAS